MIEKDLLIRICRACGVQAAQRPNGSYLCLKCDPTVSLAEFLNIARSGHPLTYSEYVLTTSRGADIERSLNDSGWSAHRT